MPPAVITCFAYHKFVTSWASPWPRQTNGERTIPKIAWSHTHHLLPKPAESEAPTQ